MDAFLIEYYTLQLLRSNNRCNIVRAARGTIYWMMGRGMEKGGKGCEDRPKEISRIIGMNC